MRDWNDFQYILALEEGRSMKQAAELLGTDPTTVSRHIKRISEDMGMTLFEMRKGGAWELTPLGKTLSARAKQFKNQIESVDPDEVAGSTLQSVKITSLEFLLTHYLAPRLHQGMDLFPESRIELVGTDRRVSLAFGEADLALRFGRPTEGNLVTSKIATLQIYVWSYLGNSGQDWVGFQEDLDWTPEMQMGFKHFQRPPLIRVTSYAAAQQVSRSVGLPFLAPRGAMPPNSNAYIVEDCAPAVRNIWSVIHETRRLDPRLAAVREWAKAAILEAENG